MNTRLVINGYDEDDKKVVIAIELIAEEQQVRLCFSPLDVLQDDVVTEIKKKWAEGSDFNFGNEFTILNRSTMSESLLPDELKVEETGKLRMRQNEWAYLIAMQKLWEAFEVEFKGITEKVDKLEEYDQEIYDELKSFWERVLGHRKERNIDQERVDQIKGKINEQFELLKSLKQGERQEKLALSTEAKTMLEERLKTVHEKIQASNSFKELSQELKNIHADWRKAPLRKDHRIIIKNQIDKGFSDISEKIQGLNSNRYDKRIAGLEEVIQKMERSLDRDRNDLDFQKKRMDSKNINQFEIQLREAKFKMIEDKISSKEAKLVDIRKTLNSLKEKAGGNKSKPTAQKEEE